MECLDSKKGQIENYMAIPVFLFIFALIIIFAYLILNNLITSMATMSIWDSTMQTTANGFLKGFRIFDYLFVFILISLIVGLIISSYKIRTAPIYAIVSIVFAPFLGFISYFMNYVFSQIVSQSVFTTTMAYFGKTLLICTNLHWVTLAAIIIGVISLFAKKEEGGTFVGQ